LDDVLDSGDYDAIALFTPIPDHARHVLQVLDAGLHCACAVPMTTTLEDIERVVAAQRRTGLVYMMMETSAATPEFFFLQQLIAAGEMGKLQFLRGVWHNNLENHPGYWQGLPPMHYITHPLGPLLALSGKSVRRVCCFGSGAMRQELHEIYGNPYPIETAIFKLRDSDLTTQITSIVIETALQNKETFDLWGTKQSFTWATFRDDRHALTRMQPVWQDGPRSVRHTVFRFDAPSADERLPAPMRDIQPRRPHPHLVHEFVRAIVEGRQPWIDAPTAANWTAPGICAHQSAMNDGAPADVPYWE
jgi:predicted dehydrogenase